MAWAGVLILVVLPMLAVSLLVALVPVPPGRTRALVMAAVIVACLAAVVLLGEPRRLWLALLAPAMLIAAVRLVRTVTPRDANTP